MSKKKGLSVEDKRTRLLDLFHERKDVFTLKELEKIAPKEKGIVMQSVKDILMALVSDDLVESDKIGSSTYFWSLPSKTINTKIHKIEELKTKISEMKSKSKKLDSELLKYEMNDKQSADKEKGLKELHELEKRRTELKAKLEELKDCDPQLFQQMQTDCNVSKEAINRWTDNVFAVKKWLKDNLFFEEAVINEQFNIPEDFDYPE